MTAPATIAAPSDAVSLETAARETGVSRHRILVAAAKGELTLIRLGERLLVSRGAVLEYRRQLLRGAPAA